MAFIEDIVGKAIPEKSLPNMWDCKLLSDQCLEMLAINAPVKKWSDEDGVDDQEVFKRILEKSDENVAFRRNMNNEIMKDATTTIMIQILDDTWKSHLQKMDYLRQGIGLRAYGQKDPLNEYKTESYGLFEEFLANAGTTTTRFLSHVAIEGDENQQPQNMPPKKQPTLDDSKPMHSPAKDDIFSRRGQIPIGHITDTKKDGGDNYSETNKSNDSLGAPFSQPESQDGGNGASSKMFEDDHIAPPKEPPRNSACPCGSGKKYKHCHGKKN